MRDGDLERRNLEAYASEENWISIPSYTETLLKSKELKLLEGSIMDVYIPSHILLSVPKAERRYEVVPR